MNTDTKEYIERMHNVTIDETGEFFNNNDLDTDYGWYPVPTEWLTEAYGELTDD